MVAGRAAVEPIPDEPAAIVETGGRSGDATAAEGKSRDDGRALVIADYHAGIEAGLRREGVSLPSHAADRREHLLDLLADTDAGQVVFLGDLGHAIGAPRDEERNELEELFGLIAERASITVVKGNHDGGIENFVAEEFPDATVTPTDGTRLGAIGFAHGQTWPAPEVVRAPICCVAHEHPTVRLTDSVGGRQVERVWLRGALNRTPFDAHERNTPDDSDGRTSGSEAGDDAEAGNGELVVFPAFNDLVGGTWVNVPEQGFLSPFLPDGLANGEAYLLDGTRLGEYRQV